MKPRYKYQFAQNWSKWPDCVHSISQISSEQVRVSFYREKKSHRGISKFKNIRELIAKQVDQCFLSEICKLENLEYLSIETISATDLGPFDQLFNLRFLKLEGIRKASDFKPIVEHKTIDCLFIESAKNLESLAIFNNSHHLKALGVEGGMYSKQKIKSLKPLSGLKRLEALFMSSVQLDDKNLEYLAEIPNLKVFECARFAPKKSFFRSTATITGSQL